MIFFIFGGGYSGRAFAAKTSYPVYGTTRNPQQFSNLKKSNIRPLLFHNNQLDQSSLFAILERITHLIISIPPSTNQEDPVLELPQFQKRIQNLQWICYLSTVGVYGNHNGHWVDERSICRTTSPYKKKRIDIENKWLLFSKKNNIPLAILRLAGIYGPGRNAFVKLRTKKAHLIIKEGQVFNRIHVADIAGAIKHLAHKKQIGTFNLCDNQPAPPQNVITFAAQLMGIKPPPEIPFEKANLDPITKSFYKDNKRVSNASIIRNGYNLLYPNYQQALTNMWHSNQW
ncbi:MAG: Nucleoside-diphosphate-sugar epimerase [Candidatus Tokpelaia sp. JSC161]|jgi:nucleoside-diphosphate-sugar epimerase|nr:MAG: Nucleoside-diphosphate-sugar epimerase [Candidatus Tokpelaia sp. JSC161]